MKIVYQGIAGSYSESCAKHMFPDIETIPCKTFDECFEKAYNAILEQSYQSQTKLQETLE